MAQAFLSGSRLAYVVTPIKGTVKRKKYYYDKENGRIGSRMMDEPGGFLVYFPMGHALRIRSQEDLKQYKLDQPPQIIDLEGIHNPNSSVGKLLTSQDDEARRGAYGDLEAQVIAIVKRRCGNVTVHKEA